jgi:hypothetical protein
MAYGDENMFLALWEWIKSLFGGKGTTQIGSRNQSVSGLTVGDVDGPVAVGSGNIIHYHQRPSTVLPKAAELDLTGDEKALLLNMEKSQEGTLMLVKNDIGLMMLVDGEPVYDIFDAAARMRWFEAFEHLVKREFIKDIEHNGETYHLASAGRRIAENARRPPNGGGDEKLEQIEVMMPELFAEMRADLVSSPITREFILKNTKGVQYWHDPKNPAFEYSADVHEAVESKVQVLENHGLVRDVSINDVPRYRMTEQLVSLLLPKK